MLTSDSGEQCRHSVPAGSSAWRQALTNSGKLRVAVGVIDDFEQMEETVAELARSGASPGSTAVLTIPGTLCERLLSVSVSADDGRRRDWPTVLIRSQDGDPQPMPKLREKGGVDAAVLVDLIVRFEDWIQPRLAQNLSRHLTDGACLLFVHIASDETELAISKALLSRSVDLVQFHDVARST